MCRLSATRTTWLRDLIPTVAEPWGREGGRISIALPLLVPEIISAWTVPYLFYCLHSILNLVNPSLLGKPIKHKIHKTNSRNTQHAADVAGSPEGSIWLHRCRIDCETTGSRKQRQLVRTPLTTEPSLCVWVAGRWFFLYGSHSEFQLKSTARRQPNKDWTASVLQSDPPRVHAKLTHTIFLCFSLSLGLCRCNPYCTSLQMLTVS